MKISVVIPAFNEEANIGNCLRSLKKQSRPADEIIVVDNNSTDKTAQIAKKLGATVILEKKQGIAFARNAGFNAAKGDIIARIDADSTAHHNWLRLMENGLHKNPESVAITGIIYYPDFGFFGRSKTCVRFYAYFVRLLSGIVFLRASNFAVYKKQWQKIRGKLCDTAKLVHEDWDISFHLQDKSKVAYSQEIAVNTSSRRSWEKPFSFFIVYPFMFFRTLWLHRLQNHK